MGAKTDNAWSPHFGIKTGNGFENFDQLVGVVTFGFTIKASDEVIHTFGGGSGFISPGLGSTSDAISIAKGQLRSLQAQIRTSLPSYTDISSRNHLLDLTDRIELALKPR